MKTEHMKQGDPVASELRRIHAGLTRTLGNLERWMASRGRDARPCLDLSPEQIIHEPTRR